MYYIRGSEVNRFSHIINRQGATQKVAPCFLFISESPKAASGVHQNIYWRRAWNKKKFLS